MILAAAETVTSPGWWSQAASIVVTVAGAIGTIATAIYAVYRLVPPVRRRWEARKEKHRLERAAALAEIIEPIVTRVVEPAVADLRAQVVETQSRVAISERKIRAELADHTDAEQMFAAQLVRAVVAAGAARQSDIREHPGRSTDVGGADAPPDPAV